MARIKWGLFLVMAGTIAWTITGTMVIGLPVEIVGYVLIFIDRDLWDRPSLNNLLEKMAKLLGMLEYICLEKMVITCGSCGMTYSCKGASLREANGKAAIVCPKCGAGNQPPST